MADRVMRFPGVTVVLVAVLAMAQAASAQTMADPTRPPAALVDNAGEASVPPEMVLQSVLIPKKGRPLAVIGGQTVKLGEMFDDRRLVKVSDREVVLEGPNGKESLPLTPGVEKTNVIVKKNRKPSAVRAAQSEVKP